MYSSLFRVSCLLFGNVAAIQTPSEAVHLSTGAASAAAATAASAVTEKKRGKPLLFIGVSIAADDVETRQNIRDCWMQHEYMKGDNPVVQAKFMVAKPPEGSEAAKLLNADMAAHDDFVQTDTVEGYHKLTQKVTEFFKWAVDNTDTEFVMKLDGDMFPNLGYLKPLLTSYITDGIGYTYLGDLVWDVYPTPGGKYGQDPNVWPAGTPFPGYASGPGYILRRDLVEKIFGNGYTGYERVLLDNEDANTGYWVDLARQNGANVSYQYVYDRTDDSCRPIGTDPDRCCNAKSHEEDEE